MRIAFEMRGGRTYFDAEPGEYDGVPVVSQVMVASVPRVVIPSRVALASTVLFAPWISGELETAHGLNPLTARLIPRLLHREVFVKNVDLAPGSYAERQSSLSVSLAERPQPAGAGDSLVVLPHDRWNGARGVGGAQVEAASSAWVLASLRPGARYLCEVAIGLVFAEDHRAGVLVPSAPPPSGLDMAALGLVMRSVGLRLGETSRS